MNKKGIELKNNSKIEVTDDTGQITIYEREDKDLEKILLSESEFPELTELKDEDGSMSYRGINQIMDFDGLFYYLTLTIRFFSDKTGLIEILPSFPFNPISKKRETIINEKKAIKNIRWKYIEESQKLKEELLESTAIKLNLGDDEVLEYQYKSELEEDNVYLIISKNEGEGDYLKVSEVNFPDAQLTFYVYDSASKSYIQPISKSTLRFYSDNTMTLTEKNLDNSLNVKKLKLKLTPILLKDNSTIEVTDLTTGETKKYESFIKFKIQKALEDEFLIEKNYIKDKSTNMAPILYLSNESNQYVYTDVINTNFKRTITFFSNQKGTFSTTGKPPYDISWKYISETPEGIVLEGLEAQNEEIIIPELESELRDVTDRGKTRKTRDVTNRRKTRDVTNREKTDNGIILLATAFLFKKLK
tara:strand:+ start:1213 stop:2463 length:1251 start_codon:yes stop_codon:yes gene_type:complete